MNLLGVARQSSRLRGRLGNIRIRVSDVLLLQGWDETLTDVMRTLGCLPLVDRRLRLGLPRRALLALTAFAAGIAVAGAGLAPVQVALSGAAVAAVLLGFLSPREVYESIDWSIIVLLGAMIPVGQALQVTGGAGVIAAGLLDASGQMPPAATVDIVLVATMFLSDIVNNAAAALVMAPIATGLAAGLGVSTDPFLMAVAVGASAAFLTPIGHQSNTLVMGPGGYRFHDYWRLGLPLELVIVAVGLPTLLWAWPL